MKEDGVAPIVSDLVLDLEFSELVDLLRAVELASLACCTQTEIGTDVDLVRSVILVVDGESLLRTAALTFLAPCAAVELGPHYHSDLLQRVQTCTDIGYIGFDDPLAYLRTDDLRKLRES